MGAFDDDPVAAARWTRDRFDGDLLEHPDAFRLERPPGWTIRGTAGERYRRRPPPDGPAVDVDISLTPRHRAPADLDVARYRRLFLTLIDDPVQDLVVTTDAFGRRADGRWTEGETVTAAAALMTRSFWVLATTSALGVDDDAVRAGALVLAALQPLGGTALRAAVVVGRPDAGQVDRPCQGPAGSGACAMTGSAIAPTPGVAWERAMRSTDRAACTPD